QRQVAEFGLQCRGIPVERRTRALVCSGGTLGASRRDREGVRLAVVPFEKRAICRAATRELVRTENGTNDFGASYATGVSEDGYGIQGKRLHRRSGCASAVGCMRCI